MLAMPDVRPLIFIHVPKTAGTTINGILQQNVPRDARFKINPHAIQESKAQLAALDEDARARIRLLYGHMGFGWHTLLPTTADYATLLREPVARVVSHYSYVRYRADHDHYLRAVVEREQMSLADYVRSGVCDEVNNGQVRLLSGLEDIVQQPYGASAILYGSNDAELLAKARHNLRDRFVLVGLQERFAETLQLMEYRLGMADLRHRSRNVGDRDYEKVIPTDEDIAVIREYNQLDSQLYQDASWSRHHSLNRIQ